MNINDTHKLFLRISDHEQAGYFPPADIDSFLDRASMWLFNDYLRVYAEDTEAYEALSPFKKKLDFTTNSSGLLTTSSLVGYEEYVQLMGGGLTVSVVDAVTGLPRAWNVDIIKEDELGSRLNSQILKPSSTYPIAEETARGVFQFYPEATHAGKIRYFKRPAKPVFNYTQTGRVVTYNPTGSVDLEWGEQYVNKVIAKALQLAGINLDNKFLIEMGMMLPNANV